MRLLLIAPLLAVILADPAYAACMEFVPGHVYCGDGRCMRDKAGVHCSPTNSGGIMTNKDGLVFCGSGQCIRDKKGSVYCAPTEDGKISLNMNGIAQCGSDRCEGGSQSLCVSIPKAEYDAQNTGADSAKADTTN